jgi:hypothetical protein
MSVYHLRLEKRSGFSYHQEIPVPCERAKTKAGLKTADKIAKMTVGSTGFGLTR